MFYCGKRFKCPKLPETENEIFFCASTNLSRTALEAPGYIASIYAKIWTKENLTFQNGWFYEKYTQTEDNHAVNTAKMKKTIAKNAIWPIFKKKVLTKFVFYKTTLLCLRNHFHVHAQYKLKKMGVSAVRTLVLIGGRWCYRRKFMIICARWWL